MLFLLISFVGAADGNPHKLYKPRDYKGDYCGLEDLEEHQKLLRMMNISHMVDPIMKQLVCSSVSQASMKDQRDALTITAKTYTNYLCSCCIMPCVESSDRPTCKGSLAISDITNLADVDQTIGVRMSQLNNFSNGAALLGPSEAESAFSVDSIFDQMNVYFVAVCMTGSCAISPTNARITRKYNYEPDPDSSLFTAWKELAKNGPSEIKTAMTDHFEFASMDLKDCPYSSKYCVPTPGVDFREAPNNYCIPKLEDGVSGALGSAATDALEGLGSSSIASTGADGLGGLAGEVMDTFDVLVIVVVWAFVIGLVFVVLLRFIISCLVWLSLGLVSGLLVLGGGMAVVRADQCKGASLFDSGRQSAVAVTVAATTAVTNAATGQTCSEAMTGNGADYRGCQTRTVSGKLCQEWDEDRPHTTGWNKGAYPNKGLAKNYCRNPLAGKGIWCVTTNIEKVWEACRPIGVITPECERGYVIETEFSRDALRICGYIIWGLAGLWILAVLCLYSRIRLAIKINEVAATFVSHTPKVLLIPIGQSMAAVSYSLMWAASASFLISQVPVSYTSKENFATWTEAMGTAEEPGKCNPIWPQGFAWKTDDCKEYDPKCWRCAPPRYVFDWYFAYSFFSYLWVNALFVAMGQCIIACAVGMWFFTPPKMKGKISPVWKSVKTVIRYHMGSLIFGALILAIVQFIRYFMKYLEKQAAAQKNKVMVMILKVLQCCIWCFEKIIKFLNKNAYIQVALLGTNFCTSAKRAFHLIMRNLARFGILIILGSIINFIGTCFIIVGTTFSGYFILQAVHPTASPVFPVLLYLCISWVVAKLFMNVFGLAVDTSMQCFLIVEEAKDKHPELAQNIPASLQKIAGYKGPSTEKESRIKPGGE